MKNDHRYSRRHYPEYNEQWDAFADRDRYERDYYQNQRYRPQGYSYRSGDMYGAADYNRHGTRYAGSDFDNNYDRYGNRMGGYDADFGPRGRDHRDYDYDRTRYGYAENPDSWYNRHRSDYYNRQERQRPYEGDRNWWNKTTDEVASWFGDDDAERRRDHDRRMENHRGKGPKGYHRSDERIKSELEDELCNDSYVDASEMEVTVQNAVVTLSGSVDSKWIKRRAEDIAETINGVEDVKDHLIVRKESRRNADFYSNADAGSKTASGSGNMTSNTSHKTGNTQKMKA